MYIDTANISIGDMAVLLILVVIMITIYKYTNRKGNKNDNISDNHYNSNNIRKYNNKQKD